MSVQTLSRKELRHEVESAGSPKKSDGQVRMLFVPNKIDEHNFKEITTTYNTVFEDQFNTVVVIESYQGTLEKKLAMPSNRHFTTRFGDVPVNDFLRNEFCDEEDDFFIADEGYSESMSMYHHLPVLQALFDDFEVVSLQIGDYDPAIIRELAHTLDELLLYKNALIVFCCDVPSSNPEELDKLRKLILNENESGLLHYLNSDDKTVKGARAFMSGILVARAWNYEVELLDQMESANQICGFARYAQPEPVKF